MRTIKYTNQFKRDYKREKKSNQAAKLDKQLTSVIQMLADDRQLPKKFFDHALSNNWKDHRDCHIRPDLILIYRKPDERNLGFCQKSAVFIVAVAKCANPRLCEGRSPEAISIHSYNNLKKQR